MGSKGAKHEMGRPNCQMTFRDSTTSQP